LLGRVSYYVFIIPYVYEEMVDDWTCIAQQEFTIYLKQKFGKKDQKVGIC
jgi:hypothetical protein